MGTIYEIICWTTGRRYVGKTTQNLQKRLIQHISAFRKKKNFSSALVLEHGNYEIYELEKVEDKTKLREREFYYIQHSDCVNVRDNTYDRKVGDKKYRNGNRGVILQSKIKYRETNKEKISEKRKETYTCECGSTLTIVKKSRHEKTQIHLNFLKNNSTNKDEEKS
jgi:hypothetical protein